MVGRDEGTGMMGSRRDAVGHAVSALLTKTVKQAPGASNYIEHLICVRVYGDLRSPI